MGMRRAIHVTSLADRRQEVATKLTILRQYLATHGYDGAELTLLANTAWLTAGGALHVGEATDRAASSLFVTPEHMYVLTDTIEEPRLRDEECLDELGFEFVAEPWYARGRFLQSAPQRTITTDAPGGTADLAAEAQRMRMRLQPGEAQRMRGVCQLASDAVAQVIRGVRPGQSEYTIAARLAAASRERGGAAIVTLVASDERIYRYRHPLPTEKLVERYVMLVLCLRQHGLVGAVTRLVHFGPLPAELRAKAEAVAQIDARLMLGAQPGRTLGDMFALARQAYADVGYPEAIEEHHQGGAIAYLARETLAVPDNPAVIAANQAFAWNPSIRGVKSEDTMLLTASGPDVLTQTPNWPQITITVDGQSIARPAILEV